MGHFISDARHTLLAEKQARGPNYRDKAPKPRNIMMIGDTAICARLPVLCRNTVQQASGE
jgi:hypothetical protein